VVKWSRVVKYCLEVKSGQVVKIGREWSSGQEWFEWSRVAKRLLPCIIVSQGGDTLKI
jgi:hypothetical protein